MVLPHEIVVGMLDLTRPCCGVLQASKVRTSGRQGRGGGGMAVTSLQLLVREMGRGTRGEGVNGGAPS